MDLKRAAETFIVYADLDSLVGRALVLVKAHETFKKDGLRLISDDDFIEVYRLLTDLHERAIDGVEPETVAPTILRLRLKLTVLEVMISSYLDTPSPMQLH